MGVSKTSAGSMNKAEATLEAVRLRKAGFTQREIAKQIGLSPGYVNKLLKAALEDFQTRTTSETEDLRALEVARMDQALRGIWPAVIKGNLGAVDRLLKISDQRCRLFGLYAPAKTALTDPTGKKEFTGGGLSALLREVSSGERGGET